MNLKLKWKCVYVFVCVCEKWIKLNWIMDQIEIWMLIVVSNGLFFVYFIKTVYRKSIRKSTYCLSKNEHNPFLQSGIEPVTVAITVTSVVRTCLTLTLRFPLIWNRRFSAPAFTVTWLNPDACPPSKYLMAIKFKFLLKNYSFTLYVAG